MSKIRAVVLYKSQDFRCLEEIHSPPVPAWRDHELMDTLGWPLIALPCDFLIAKRL